MGKWVVTIPQWSDGLPLRIEAIEAANEADALATVVAWVNRRAGYNYCTALPPGTTVKLAVDV